MFAADGSPYWLRIECRTMGKLPRPRTIPFGIRVRVTHGGSAATAPTAPPTCWR